MRVLAPVIAAFALWAHPLGAQAPTQADSAAIRQTALDYIEGWYSGDAARMERALHPELAKRIVTTGANGRSVLGQMGAMTLVNNTWSGGGSSTPEAQRRKTLRILDVFQNSAMVRIDASTWIDYLELAKWNGRWVIVNVLWEQITTAPTGSSPAPAPMTMNMGPGTVARSNPALTKEFEGLYAKQADAFMHKDVAAALSFDAPDHMIHLLNGDSVSRAQLEQSITTFYTSGRLVREIAFGYDVLDVSLRGADVVALVEQDDHRVQVRADGKAHDIDARVIHRDIWRQTPQGWRRYLTEEVKQVKFAVDSVEIVPEEHRPKGGAP